MIALKRILIADDDFVTRSMLSRALRSRASDIEIMTAKDGEEAIRKIEQGQVDLVIADFNLPAVDAFELLSFFDKRNPRLPVFVITAFGTIEVKSRIEAFHTARYFEKPLNVDVFVQEVLKEIDSVDEDRLTDVDLPEFLRRAEREKRTFTIRVRSGERTGMLHIFKGSLISASLGASYNVKAAEEILGWERNAIEIDKLAADVGVDIMTPLEELLARIQTHREEKEMVTADFREREGESADDDWLFADLEEGTKEFLIEANKILSGKGDHPEEPKKGSRTDAEIEAEENPEATDPPVWEDEVGMSQSVPTDSSKKEKGFQKNRKKGLAAIFQKTGGILGYQIFDENDRLQEKFRTAGVDSISMPGNFLRTARGLQHVLERGPFRFMVLTASRKQRFLLFEYHEKRIVMSVSPEFKAEAFVRQFEHGNATPG